MKKLKIIIVTIISILLIIFLINKVESYPYSGEWSLDSLPVHYGGTGAKYYDLWIRHLQESNNIYCVSKNDRVGDSSTPWKRAAKAVISGDSVKFYEYDAKGLDVIDDGYGNSGKHNNKLAAIVYEGELGRYTSSLGTTSSQNSLWSYWNSWVSSSGAGSYGFKKGGNNSGSYDYSYDSYADQYNYDVTIHFLVPGWSDYSSYQNLIVVERGGKRERLIDVPVVKNWSDKNNINGVRPGSITVRLYRNGSDTGKTLTLSAGNGWRGKFTGLKPSGTYTAREEGADMSALGYTVSYSGTTITNTLPMTNVKVTKVWKDHNDREKKRPSSIKVVLYEEGNRTNKTGTLNSSNGWKYTFSDLVKYRNGREIVYTVKEEEVKTDDLEQYINTTEGDQKNGYKITNIHYDGYVEITGTVWEDRIDGKDDSINSKLDDEEKRLEGIKVTLKDNKGNIIKTVGDNGELLEYKFTDKDGNYKFIINYDNRQNVYKLYEDAGIVKTRLEGSYVEFEYDGMTYTTVKAEKTGENTSKAVENKTERDKFDENHTKVTPNTLHPGPEYPGDNLDPENWKDDIPNEWKDKIFTATTKGNISFKNYKDQTEEEKRKVVIENCDGNKYEHTNFETAEGEILTTPPSDHSHSNCPSQKETTITVVKIKNVNLGLFRREKPDVAIVSDLSKVEVIMNNQAYTYLYNVKSKDLPGENKIDDLQVKFQNKYTYTYRRPVNPADISYVNDNHPNAMSVFVTYEVKAANLSSTLETTIKNITNAYDSNYTVKSIYKGINEKTRTEITQNTSETRGYAKTEIYGKTDDFNEITIRGVDITLAPLTQSNEDNTVVITYEVSQEEIKGLLNNEATLNNAVEIETFSTQYGEKTVYANAEKGGRTKRPYGGYDYNSHPGDAGIALVKCDDGIYRLKSTENGKVKETPQDDTDLAPSFVLCQSKPKTLAGTIFEDTNVKNNGERIGNGKYEHNDKQNEKVVEKVKVELYNLDGNPAQLYKTPGSKEASNAIVYSDGNGNYALEGVVTGEYFVKYTYGNEDKENATTMDGGETTVNARNYKSTIITENKMKEILKGKYDDTFDKKWHITHEDDYSVAVDDMLDRLDIDSLRHDNFYKGENMTAYTKPFKTQIEFEATGTSNVSAKDEKDRETGTNGGTIINGIIKDEKDVEITNILSKLDFGIIERPREDIFTQKTITYTKITLANGQVLVEGDPRNQNLNFIKAMGFNQNIQTGAEARFVGEKVLLAELDAELTKGAQLEIHYEVTGKNNSEIDYDYGEKGDYLDLGNGKYITLSPKAKYYYYGDSAGLNKLTTTLRFVDYLDNDITFDKGDDANKGWTELDADKLYSDNLISEDTNKFIKNNKYKILQGENEETITLASGQSIAIKTMKVRKVLTSSLENVYDNAVEILEIDGKTARTIQESKGGQQVEKTYKPGNYVPNFKEEDIEQDDDRVRVIITPPTGITNNTTIYIIVGLVGLLTIVVGIVFIKKIVLKK